MKHYSYREHARHDREIKLNVLKLCQLGNIDCGIVNGRLLFY